MSGVGEDANGRNAPKPDQGTAPAGTAGLCQLRSFR